MISTSVVRGSIPGPCIYDFRCKNLALNIIDCVSLLGCGSSVVGAPLVSLAGEVKDPTQGGNV